MKELRIPSNVEKCRLHAHIVHQYIPILFFILSCCTQSSKNTKTSVIEMIDLAHEDKGFSRLCIVVVRQLSKSKLSCWMESRVKPFIKLHCIKHALGSQ